MKRIILLLTVLMAAGTVLNAQNKNVVACYNYNRYGEFDKAKEAIDKASVHPKTAGKAKTWWYLGQTYQNIAIQCMFNKKQNYCDLAPDAAIIAKDAYSKALAMNMVDPKWQSLDIFNNDADFQVFMKLVSETKNVSNTELLIDILQNRFSGMGNIFVNKGIAEYESDDLEDNKKAVESFETSLVFSSLTMIDSAVIYYTGLAAEKAKMYDKAIKYLNKSIELNYGKDQKSKAYSYYYLAKVYNQKGDTAMYLETLKKGIDAFPDNNTALVTDLINYYLTTDQTEAALSYLKIAIEKTPDNHTYYFAQGSLYDKKEDFENAIVSYKKAIELNDSYFEAYYNLGAVYYNKAAKLIEDANELPIEKQKEYDKLQKEAKEQFKLAQPYLEKAHELDAKDLATMQSLKEIYVRLQMYDKSKEMKAKIEASTAGDK